MYVLKKIISFDTELELLDNFNKIFKFEINRLLPNNKSKFFIVSI